MSEENMIIDHDENEFETTTPTTTRFQQTKTKVTEFVKRNKKTLLLTAGSTALLGLGAAVISSLKEDDQTEPYLEFDFSDDAEELTVTDPTSGDTWYYGELSESTTGDSNEDSDVEIVSEETITESTE